MAYLIRRIARTHPSNLWQVTALVMEMALPDEYKQRIEEEE